VLVDVVLTLFSKAPVSCCNPLITLAPYDRPTRIPKRSGWRPQASGRDRGFLDHRSLADCETREYA